MTTKAKADQFGIGLQELMNVVALVEQDEPLTPAHSRDVYAAAFEEYLTRADSEPDPLDRAPSMEQELPPECLPCVALKLHSDAVPEADRVWQLGAQGVKDAGLNDRVKVRMRNGNRAWGTQPSDKLYCFSSKHAPGTPEGQVLQDLMAAAVVFSWSGRVQRCTAFVVTDDASGGGSASRRPAPGRRGGAPPAAASATPDTLGPARPNDERYKTVLCEDYNKTGWCSYGNRCSFAHGLDELRRPLTPYKVKLCTKFDEGRCRRPQCGYAHGRQDLHCYEFQFRRCRHGDRCDKIHDPTRIVAEPRPAAAATVWCKDFLLPSGCSHGDACHYAHSEDDLAPSMPVKRQLPDGRHVEHLSGAFTAPDLSLVGDRWTFSTESMRVMTFAVPEHWYRETLTTPLTQWAQNLNVEVQPTPVTFRMPESNDFVSLFVVITPSLDALAHAIDTWDDIVVCYQCQATSELMWPQLNENMKRGASTTYSVEPVATVGELGCGTQVVPGLVTPYEPPRDTLAMDFSAAIEPFLRSDGLYEPSGLLLDVIKIEPLQFFAACKAEALAGIAGNRALLSAYVQSLLIVRRLQGVEGHNRFMRFWRDHPAVKARLEQALAEVAAAHGLGDVETIMEQVCALTFASTPRHPRLAPQVRLLQKLHGMGVEAAKLSNVIVCDLKRLMLALCGESQGVDCFNVVRLGDAIYMSPSGLRGRAREMARHDGGPWGLFDAGLLYERLVSPHGSVSVHTKLLLRARLGDCEVLHSRELDIYDRERVLQEELLSPTTSRPHSLEELRRAVEEGMWPKENLGHDGESLPCFFRHEDDVENLCLPHPRQLIELKTVVGAQHSRTQLITAVKLLMYWLQCKLAGVPRVRVHVGSYVNGVKEFPPGPDNMLEYDMPLIEDKLSRALSWFDPDRIMAEMERLFSFLRTNITEEGKLHQLWTPLYPSRRVILTVPSEAKCRKFAKVERGRRGMLPSDLYPPADSATVTEEDDADSDDGSPTETAIPTDATSPCN